MLGYHYLKVKVRVLGILNQYMENSNLFERVSMRRCNFLDLYHLETLFRKTINILVFENITYFLEVRRYVWITNYFTIYIYLK